MLQRWIFLILVFGLIAGVSWGQKTPEVNNGDALRAWMSPQQKERKIPKNLVETEKALQALDRALEDLRSRPKEEQAALAKALGAQRDSLESLRALLSEGLKLNLEALPGRAKELNSKIAVLKTTLDAQRIQANKSPEEFGTSEADALRARRTESAAAETSRTALAEFERQKALHEGREESLKTLSKQVEDADAERRTKDAELVALQQTGTTGLKVSLLGEEIFSLRLDHDRLSRLREFLEFEASSGVLEAEKERAQLDDEIAKLGLTRASLVLSAIKKVRDDETARLAREKLEKDKDELGSQLPGFNSLAEKTLLLRVSEDQLRALRTKWKGRLEGAGAVFVTAEAGAEELSQSYRADPGYSVPTLRRDLSRARQQLKLAIEFRKEFQKDLSHATESSSLARRIQDEAEGSLVEALRTDGVADDQPGAVKYKDERDSIKDLESQILSHRSSLQTHQEEWLRRFRKVEAISTENENAILQRLRWTRSESKVSADSIPDALDDAQGFVQKIGDWPDRLGSYLSDYFSDGSKRKRLFLGGGLIVLLLGLMRLIRRRIPQTYDWLEDKFEGQAKSRLWQVVGLIIRRTVFSFFLALVFVAVPWAVGFEPAVVGTLAVLFCTPVLYRVGRVLLDVLLAPNSKEGGLLPIDNVLCRLFHRCGRYILNIALVFVPLGILMDQGGYAAINSGFTELWWLVFKVLTTAILLFTVFRPQVLKKLIRGDSVLAASVKSWILIGYPFVVGSLLFIFVLGSLRYFAAERFFGLLFLQTFGLLLLAYVLYRQFVRRVLKGRDVDTPLNSDHFSSESEFMNAGRSRFLDRLVRLGFRLLLAVPTVILLMGLWRTVDFSWLHARLWGNDPGVTITSLFKAVAVIVLIVMGMRTVKGLLTFVVAPALKLEQGVRYTMATLASYVVLAIGLIVVLNVLRVEGSQIALVTSALVFGIGFGLQSIVKNFISGLILLIERPVNVGDRVEIGSNSGKVEKITLRATTVMTWDGVGIVIPNEELIGGILTNHSLGKPRLRTRISIGVGYGSDVGKVRELVTEIMKKHGLVLKNPGSDMYFVGFGDSSLDFQARFWTRMSSNRLQVASDLRYAIEAAFKREGIEIPFPQRDINFKFDSEADRERLREALKDDTEAPVDPS
ncbi:MAG: mechanosensitive ion channel domain-containing protein [Planctomycetota bacterium]